MRAREREQTRLGERIDDPIDTRPVRGSRTHGARFCAREQRRASHAVRPEQARRRGDGAQLRVLGWVAVTREGIVAEGRHGPATRIHNERAERVRSLGAGPFGDAQTLVQVAEVFGGEGVFHCAPS